MHPHQIPVGFIIRVVVNLDQLTPVIKAPVINPRRIGRVGDDHQGVGVLVTFDFIHRANPAQAGNFLTDHIDFFVWEGRL